MSYAVHLVPVKRLRGWADLVDAYRALFGGATVRGRFYVHLDWACVVRPCAPDETVG